MCENGGLNTLGDTLWFKKKTWLAFGNPLEI